MLSLDTYKSFKDWQNELSVFNNPLISFNITYADAKTIIKDLKELQNTGKRQVKQGLEDVYYSLNRFETHLLRVLDQKTEIDLYSEMLRLG